MSEIAWVTMAVSVVMAIITAVSVTAAMGERRVTQRFLDRLTNIEKIIDINTHRINSHDTILAVNTVQYTSIEKAISEMKVMLQAHIDAGTK
jgi:hypothetical protein